MPTTYNGIGTHYYGKKNRTVRTATCRSCGRAATMESYDTRLWFVIIFIPIIPLGRKRVIDACPVCRRHFVANADDYEQARQLQVSAAQDQFRREPSPVAALQVHGTLLGFLETEQAAQFRKSVRERFPADAELMAGLAAQLERAASYQEASELYEAAYRIQPELPEARVAIARRKMAEGHLDEARTLLDFLEAPGAGEHYALGPLDVLSTYYQKQGRHEETLAIAEHLLREVPDAGQQHKFRAFVARSEKALGRSETILPAREHSVRGLFRGDRNVYSNRLRWAVMGLVGLFLLGAGLAVNNEYIRRHRAIDIINACGAPVHVKVDDQPPQTVGDRGRIVVGEGRHRIQLTGAVDEAHDVNLKAGYLDRWLKKSAWVLIPGGEAALLEQTVYYAVNPTPSQQKLVAGRPFVALDHVDYLFEDPPHSMKVNNASTQVEKTCLRRFLGPDLQAFEIAVQTDREGALTFLEHRLRRRPDDYGLLEAYVSHFDQGQKMERAESFLKSGLDRRPVAVQWHRFYQSLAEASGHDAALVAMYDAYLKADPRNSSLLYLRGRIDSDWDRQAEYLRRAIEADPRAPLPWASRASRDAAAARWSDCLSDLKAARERKIDENSIRDLHITARLGAGEARSLLNECRTRLAANVMDITAITMLLEAAAAVGPPEDFERELTAWQNRLPMEVRGQVGTTFRVMGLYGSGKLPECVELCRRSSAADDHFFRLHSLLALKRVKEAAGDAAFAKRFEDPWDLLAVSLAWQLEGREQEAASWRERGLAKLDTMGPDARRVTAILRAGQPPSLEEIGHIILGPRRLAMVCALLAERFAAKRAEYLAAAARYNVRRVPPYQLVRVAIESRDPTKSPATAKR